MKVRIGIIFWLTIIAELSLGQGQVLMKDQMGRPIQSPKYVLDGNPFLKNEWSSVFIYSKGSKKGIQLAKANFNVLENRVEFDSNGKILFVDPILFDAFDLQSSNDTIKFQKGLVGSGLDPKKFYNILHEGKGVWIKQYNKDIIDNASSTYGSQARKVIQDDVKYYLKNGEDVLLLKMNRGYLKKAFKENEAMVKAIEANSFLLNDESTIKEFFTKVDVHLNE